MRKLLQILSILALLGVIAPPALFLAGRIELAAVHTGMLIATVVWFGLTPFWIGQKKASDD
jgi:hypothetical protein